MDLNAKQKNERKKKGSPTRFETYKKHPTNLTREDLSDVRVLLYNQAFSVCAFEYVLV